MTCEEDAKLTAYKTVDSLDAFLVFQASAGFLKL